MGKIPLRHTFSIAELLVPADERHQPPLESVGMGNEAAGGRSSGDFGDCPR